MVQMNNNRSHADLSQQLLYLIDNLGYKYTQFTDGLTHTSFEFTLDNYDNVYFTIDLFMGSLRIVVDALGTRVVECRYKVSDSIPTDLFSKTFFAKLAIRAYRIGRLRSKLDIQNYDWCNTTHDPTTTVDDAVQCTHDLLYKLDVYYRVISGSTPGTDIEVESGDINVVIDSHSYAIYSAGYTLCLLDIPLFIFKANATNILSKSMVNRLITCASETTVEQILIKDLFNTITPSFDRIFF